MLASHSVRVDGWVSHAPNKGTAEQENAMATDTEMLNFLEAMGEPSGLKWLARPSVTGRGWRLHQDPQGEHETARAALEDAMTRFVYATANAGLAREKGKAMKFCCEKFAEEAGRVQAKAGGGFMYPVEMHPNAQFEPDYDGETWNINGCCGGGCFVVTEMRFCPFCGSKLEHPSRANVEVRGDGV